MDNITNALNTRFNIALQKSSDKDFYMNLYHYFDYVVKTPELKNILDQNERDYYTKFRNIRLQNALEKTTLEAARAQLRKLEYFNLYAVGTGIYMRIYLAIDDYRNSDDLDDLQDPVMVLLFYGIDYAKKINRWDKEYLNQYNNWFDGKRNNYEEELKQFHQLMLEELAKPKALTPTIEKEPETKAVKIPLHLNLSTGDFIFYNTRGTLSPATQEFKILACLLYGDDYMASHLSLYQTLHPNTLEVRKAHRDQLSLIIRNIKKSLLILSDEETANPNIFKSIPKIGYRLIFPVASEIPD